MMYDIIIMVYYFVTRRQHSARRWMVLTTRKTWTISWRKRIRHYLICPRAHWEVG